jgi:hypothetical protein
MVPDPQQVVTYLDQFTTQSSGSMYPYISGVLLSHIELIAEAHEGCRTPHCDTCAYLARALAATTAVTTMFHRPASGDRP